MFAGLQKLDILVNNAGIGLVGGVEETALSDFQQIFRVNVEGLFLVTRSAIPLLLASRGCIVNTERTQAYRLRRGADRREETIRVLWH
ncbi:MAG: SDR family NAD(P)-dependent oxidoreductase [Bryobacteraceae bacterium]